MQMADDTTLSPRARKTIYCAVCSLPPEYCEFGGTKKKCEEWLEKAHPDQHARLYSEEVIAANLASLSVEAQKRAEKDDKKKEAKAKAAEEKATEKREASTVYIKRVERNKRKYITEVSGLENFGLDLKKVAKEFGKKFATGSSVTKVPSGGECITVQGDVSDDIFDFLTEGPKEYRDAIPEENVECIEDKKKKSGA